MKIQYTCCCGSKFIGITEDAELPKLDQAEHDFVCDQYEKFKARHASCHKKERKLMSWENANDLC